MTLQWALAHAVCDRMGRGLVTVPRLWRAARLASQNGRPRGRGGSQPARPYTALGYHEAVLSAERFYTRCAALRRTAPPKTSSSDSKSTRPQRSRLALSLARRKPDPFRTILKSLAHAHSGERKTSLDAPPRAAISAQSGPCGRLAKTARGISGRIAQTCCCLECSGCAQLHFGSPLLSGNGTCVFEHVEGDLLASQRKSVKSGVPPLYAGTN